MIAARLPFFAVMAGLSAAPALSQDADVQRGEAYLRVHCGKCHAVGRSGDSPLPGAPPFRVLHERYPVEHLAESLAEGITTGHPAMPEFRLDPAEINDVINYLKTLERPL